MGGVAERRITILLTSPSQSLILSPIAMKRDSTHPGNHREKPFGARLYGRNVEPVLELYTECDCARLYWVRPLQR